MTATTSPTGNGRTKTSTRSCVRLGIVSGTEHQAVDDARAEVLAMPAERAGLFARAERRAA
ncbi:hypothetical protein ACFYY1_24830 [Streptomyces sp. NPDC001890]|uniref:hypothetical protein n=1 Tax=Streptomyces sp. NPDC001890 TaxID=3364620 RepID=UPI00367B85E6